LLEAEVEAAWLEAADFAVLPLEATPPQDAKRKPQTAKAENFTID